ncbi:Hpt domain-containing protein [Cereibacter changlensis]|uniref:Hpt domain-containing protein n=1 Tax=Cereibacter changlensis TaxID=402884 RepID=UPI00145C9B55|nr:Hpt domain-containing protein [Cereibacter changlensis]
MAPADGLDPVRRRFAEVTAERLALIEAYFDGERDAAALREIGRIAHMTAGVAATLGHAALGRVAGQVAVELHLANAGRDWRAVEPRMRQMMLAMRAVPVWCEAT